MTPPTHDTCYGAHVWISACVQSWSEERRGTLAALNQRTKLLDGAIEELRKATAEAAAATAAAASPTGRPGCSSKDLMLGGASKSGGLGSWSKAFASSSGGFGASEGPGLDEQLERMLQRLSVDFSRVVMEATTLAEQAATDPITRVLHQVRPCEEGHVAKRGGGQRPP